MVSTIGVKVNIHVCKKEGKLVSYYLDNNQCKCHLKDKAKEDNCKKESKSCCHSAKTVKPKQQKGCCGDKTEFHQLTYSAPVQFENISLTPFLIHHPYLLQEINIDEEESNTRDFKIISDKPPLPGRSILVKKQSFLI